QLDGCRIGEPAIRAHVELVDRVGAATRRVQPGAVEVVCESDAHEVLGRLTVDSDELSAPRDEVDPRHPLVRLGAGSVDSRYAGDRPSVAPAFVAARRAPAVRRDRESEGEIAEVVLASGRLYVSTVREERSATRSGGASVLGLECRVREGQRAER